MQGPSADDAAVEGEKGMCVLPPASSVDFSNIFGTDTEAKEATIKILTKSAAQGNATAQYRLGRMYELGQDGVERNGLRAAWLYKQAAWQKHAEAQYHLGCIYKEGVYVPECENGTRITHAVAWFRGAVIETGHEKALAELRELANVPYPIAQHALGLLYEKGLGGLEPDVAKARALELYKKAADCDYAPACERLGLFYKMGRNGLPLDVAKAFELYNRAADKDYAPALYRLGVLYEKGCASLSMPPNVDKAVELYEKASQGMKAAHIRLCKMRSPAAADGLLPLCQRGILSFLSSCFHVFIKTGREEALDDIRKLANDHPMAQHALGFLYEKGHSSLEQDVAKAVELYKKADDSGYAPASHRLGMFYKMGRNGLPLDVEKAFELYETAAEDDYAPALYSLGFLYEKGCSSLGMPPNEKKAVELYEKAVELCKKAPPSLFSWKEYMEAAENRLCKMRKGDDARDDPKDDCGTKDEDAKDEPIDTGEKRRLEH